MPSKNSLHDLISKLSQGKRLSKADMDFGQESYESLRRAYQSALAPCGEAEQAAIALSEAQCVLQAQQMEADYWLAMRLDEDLAKSKRRSHPMPTRVCAGAIYQICLACYYETQIESIRATQEMPLTVELLNALTALEAALMRVNDLAQDHTRSQRMWAN